MVGWGMSHLDNTLLALGRSGSPEAFPAVLEKVAMLGSTNSISHYRAVCSALEWIGDPRAAEPLAQLLEKPGIGGYAATSIDPASGLPLDSLPGHPGTGHRPGPLSLRRLGRAGREDAPRLQ